MKFDLLHCIYGTNSYQKVLQCTLYTELVKGIFSKSFTEDSL